ncbi:cytochrome c oxidase subunit II [Alkalinema sp. FACHB-956]|uniref:cytochrome c oxidase subunit II n=1 Tax=Alkalinema sp. FACHB-956 TaxID=2692768 RepID=UPI00168286C0|nr:cytochrome c oxidase subunit II [Alkalinema sp. FACHB-956]MBD2326174.1 cytochrome c oxidase subunit II [Alkalinema sp. FACHB-956]
MSRGTILKLGIVAIVLALISLWMGQQSYAWFPPQASAESVLVDQLFSFLVTLGTFIFLGVVGTLTYAVLFQRAGKYDASDGPPIEGNITLEVVWTIIPFVLVIWIAGYSYQIYDQMSILGPMEHVHLGMSGMSGIAAAEAAPPVASADPASDRPSDRPPVEHIDVYARQWAWEFHYPQPVVTSTELHLPNRQRIQLALHSEDVLHGFFVPAFRVKQDIIPGQVIELEFTPIREGRYRLRDSQYSGTYFAAMQTDVVVESPQAYQQWLETASTQPPVPAYNRAFDEYHRAHNPISTGWKIVEPAPPPTVNVPSLKGSNP